MKHEDEPGREPERFPRRFERTISTLVTVFTACATGLATGTALAQPRATGPVIDTLGRTIIYLGDIDRTGTDILVPLVESGRFRSLQIESRGGDVEAGIAMGHAIFEHQIDVEVRAVCASSCANYIFTAARRKTIREGALVVWHGDAKQWNFMEETRRIEAKVVDEGPDRLTAREIAWLASAHRIEPMQDRLYARIGVQDGFARIGHDLRPRTSAWTIPVARMAEFGITHVEAPPDYGTAGYCRRTVLPPARVACLDEGAVR